MARRALRDLDAIAPAGIKAPLNFFVLVNRARGPDNGDGDRKQRGRRSEIHKMAMLIVRRVAYAHKRAKPRARLVTTG